MNQTSVLGLKSNGSSEIKAAPGFWRRQFGLQGTKGQTIFDLLLGVALPAFCFIFDPIVFRSGIGGGPLFGDIQIAAYALSFIEIYVLLVWLGWRERVGDHAVSIGGFLLAGAHISLIIGIIILPFSLLGIFFFGIGLLGFTPFLTAFVFWRNAQRAFNLYPERAVSRARKFAAFVLAITFVIGFPLALQLNISRAMDSALALLLEGDAVAVESATGQLKLLSYITDMSAERLINTYHQEQNVARRERLARAYLAVTGKDIAMRRELLFD